MPFDPDPPSVVSGVLASPEDALAAPVSPPEAPLNRRAQVREALRQVETALSDLRRRFHDTSERVRGLRHALQAPPLVAPTSLDAIAAQAELEEIKE